MRSIALSALALLAISSAPLLAAGPQLRGTVVDETGAPVADARVSAVCDAWKVETASNTAGDFAVNLPQSAEVSVVTAAPGFTSQRRTIPASRLGTPLHIVLSIAPVTEQVSVTPSRTEVRLADTPASVAVISRGVIETSAAPVLDDVLRQVPGFSLFRRASSRTANPTTQGVSLRGLGASGASRALVLDDGVPLNDPFGGWVYWNRVPAALLDRVEVMQGGGSDLYGSGALGGIVNMIRRPAAAVPVLDGAVSVGSLATRQLSLAAGLQVGKWSLAAAGDALTTAGYIPVEAEERGPVDIAAGSRHGVLDVSLQHATPWGGHAFVRGSGFGETRSNGTPLQQNDTRLAQLAAGGQWSVAGGGLEWRAYGISQRFDQTFSAVAANRVSERATGTQRVPSRAAGSSVQWTRAIDRHVFVTGVDFRQVTGSTIESTPGARDTSFADRGGRQRSIALFAGDTITLSSLSLTAGIRFDGWSNGDGHEGTWTEAKPARATTLFAPRSEHAVSPRVSAVYPLGRSVALTGSAYRAFRAPTLNELYRSFRVGNIVTEANRDLVAEQVTGTEAAIRLAPGGSRLFATGRVFWMEMSNPVANVTIGGTPGTILRQRENLGTIRSRGVELDTDVRLFRGIAAHAAYLFDDATVTSFAADPRLVGRLVPQQPHHGATLRVQAVEPFASIAVQARWSGAQYDDDLNQLVLAGFGAIDAFVSRRLARTAEIFMAGENLTNSRIEIAKTPVTMIGWPRSVRVGLRVVIP